MGWISFIAIVALVWGVAYFSRKGCAVRRRDESLTRAVADLDARNARKKGQSAAPPFRITIETRTVSTPPSPPRWLDDADSDQFHISYGDADGVVTDRRIKLLEVENNGSAIYLRALCALRNAERNFRADRIIHARQIVGNRLIADPETYFAERVPAHRRPDPAHESVMRRVMPSLQALIWIARADREIAGDEMDLLLDFIDARNRIGGPKFASIAWNRNRAVIEIDQVRPTLATAAGATVGMAPTGREAALVMEYATRLGIVGGVASERRATHVTAPFR
ncbi:MAG TPA: WYL domain-containing protein [Reyranella sp.]|nr:WYL domain-containing protein [Reyranella sp.]